MAEASRENCKRAVMLVQELVSPTKTTPENLQRNAQDLEAFVSRLSVRDNFWHSICSLIWLPLAFFSGIRMKQIDAKTFAAVLPFRRFNRNWYRAMAGGALDWQLMPTRASRSAPPATASAYAMVLAE